ncbi:MAG TPA: peptidylprolyl isomerase, partial [Streptosporangiaceae bacterium]|nr:peptidylprolyl isomerase [Streptosporangiaceae bacterium]
MRRVAAVLGAVVLAGCGSVRDMFTAHTDAVATVGSRALGAQRVADLFVRSRVLAVQPDILDRFGHLWVNYVLFADRVLAGDSLLDSATVQTANWPAVQQIMIQRYHQQLVAKGVTLDSARVDSIYQAGALRLIRHVLIKIDTGMTPAQVAAKQAQAQAVRSALAAGGSWDRANMQNDDSLAKAHQGSVGVLARGETVEAFDQAAFALAPGELAPVVQTPFGFHVLRRPRLSEVRAQYQQGVQQRLVAQMDSVYLVQLPQRLHFRVRSNAPATVRDVARDPLASRQSGQLLASFDGARFTAGDLARWFDVLPPQMPQQIPTARDEDLRSFVQRLAQNAMLLVEARGAGVQLTGDETAQMRADLRGQIAELRHALALDSLTAADTTGKSRSEVVAKKVDAYLDKIVQNPQTLVPVPAPLADRLREVGGWRVYPAGVQRAFELARAQKASLDSAAGRIAPPGAGSRPR